MIIAVVVAVVTTGGLIALGAVALVSLLGSLPGVHDHREVDQAAFEPASS